MLGRERITVISAVVTMAVSVLIPDGADASVADQDGATPSERTVWNRTEPPAPQELPPGFEEAEDLADVASRIGWSHRKVARFEADVAARLSADIAAERGSMSDDMRARLATSDYVTADDVATYILPETEPGEIRITTVPAGVAVNVDGDAYQPSLRRDNSQVGPPEFTGDWGNELAPSFHVNSVIDKPSFSEWPECQGETIGEIRTYVYRRILADSSPDYGYMGVHKSSVAEIVEQAGGLDCASYVDTFRTTYWIAENQHFGQNQPLYVAQSPSELAGTDCETTTVQVGYEVGGATAGISKDFERCDSYDVEGYLAPNTLTEYGISFDNNSSCSSRDRVADFAAVVRYENPNPGTPDWYWYPNHWSRAAIDPDQDLGYRPFCPGD